MRQYLPVSLLSGLLGLVLLCYGGGNGLATTRCWAMAGIALAAIATALCIQRRQLLPDVRPALVVAAVPVLVGCVQLFPFGWHHPWLEPDLALLGIERHQWSLDGQQTGRGLGFAFAWGLVAVLTAFFARNDRCLTAARWVVAMVASHAVMAFGINLFPGFWWQTPVGERLHGTFIYPNHAAAFWAMTLPVAVQLAGLRWRQSRHVAGSSPPDAQPVPGSSSWLAWVAAAALVAALLFTGSRGGILVATACVLPLGWLLLPRRRRWPWAAGVVAAISGWLWLINPTVATDRFGELINREGNLSEQAETANGRFLIWQAALPLVVQAGPLGTGLGTTELVFPRAGSQAFADLRLDHLHNDQLEWCLETGWVGVALLVLAVGLALFWLLRAPCSDPERRMVRNGAALGLLVLILHGLVEFPWHNESVALQAAVLFGLVLASRDPVAQPQSTWFWRLALGTSGVVLALGALVLWPFALADQRSLAGVDYLHKRLDQGLPVVRDFVATGDSTPTITRRSAMYLGHAILDGRPSQPFATEPWSPELWSRWVRYLTYAMSERNQELQLLRQVFGAAAQIAPSDATLWAMRARLAALDGQETAAETAIGRALILAPTSPSVQMSALIISRGLSDSSLSVQIIDRILTAGRPLPLWAWSLGGEVLGKDELAMRIWQRNSPLMARSALPWMSQQAGLTEWLIATRQVAQVSDSFRLVPPAKWWLAQTAFGDVASPTAVLPRDAEQRAVLTSRMTAAGLPIPPPLQEAVDQYGSFLSGLSRWDPTAPTVMAPPVGIETQLFRPWVRELWEKFRQTQSLLAGDGSALEVQVDGRVVAQLATDAAYPASLRQRATIVWELQHSPNWRREHGYRWTWLQGGPGAQAWVDLEAWCLVFVDGKMLGWRRGRWDLAATLAPGPHRIVIIEAW